MNNADLVNLLMSSPVIVALITVGAAMLTNSSKRPLSERAEREKIRQEERDERSEEIYRINKNLDRHINNSEEPFRKQINEKLDGITMSVSALTESVRSINTTVSSLDDRVDRIEGEVNNIDRNCSKEDVGWH